MYHNRIDITDRTFKFGIQIIELANKLPKGPIGNRISGQIVGSGISIGANTHEAQNSDSKKDFVYKLNIALREARETLYWLKIIDESKMLTNIQKIILENEEIVKILITIIRNTKKNHNID